MIVRKTAEGTATVTLGWDPVAGAAGFRFIVDGKVSHTFNGGRTSLRIAKGSSRVSVEALTIGDSGVWTPGTPPPPNGYGSKLILPSVYASPPARVVNVPTDADLSSASDTIFRFAPGTAEGAHLDGTFQRCIFDFTGTRYRNGHDGIKIEGELTDCWFKGYDIEGMRNQGILGYGTALRVMFGNGRLARNAPNFANGNEQNFHAMYVGNNGRWRHITIIDNLFDGWKYGYPVHIYSGYDIPGEGLHDSWVVSNTFQDCGLGPNPFPGVGVSILALPGQASNVIVANNVNLRCKRQLADGPVTYAAPNAEVNQGSGDYAGNGSSGPQPGSDPSVLGDPGYRAPWDTRTTGIGAT